MSGNASAINRWNTPLVRGRIRMMSIPAHSRALRMTEAAGNAAHCCANHSGVGKGRPHAVHVFSRRPFLRCLFLKHLYRRPMQGIGMQLGIPTFRGDVKRAALHTDAAFHTSRSLDRKLCRPLFDLLDPPRRYLKEPCPIGRRLMLTAGSVFSESRYDGISMIAT